LDVTGASNVLSTPEAAAIPTLTTPGRALSACPVWQIVDERDAKAIAVTTNRARQLSSPRVPSTFR
jgi:hypothetical protein